MVYIQELEWVSHHKLGLFSDAAGGFDKGCGTYFNGKYAVLKWEDVWQHSKFKNDITYLELILIALSIFYGEINLLRKG